MEIINIGSKSKKIEKMLKAYKYKIKPNEEQKILLNKHFGSIRFVYNYFLNERKKEYENNKNSLNYYDNAKSLTEIKKQEEYIWLKEINSQSLQLSIKHLDTAYIGFFKKRAAFPKFKSKHNKNSFCVPQFVKVENGKLNIPKFKDGIPIVLHRKFNGEIRQCTISKTPTNEYFVSILVETTHKKQPKTGKEVGIDLGIKDYCITSDGYKFKNNKYTKTYAKQLKKEQKHLSRKEVGSNRYNKQKLKVACLHKKITNSRVDNLHKISSQLIREYDTIYLEDLNIKGMISRCKPKINEDKAYIPNGQKRKSGLNKSISDASWGKFVELLSYKAEWNDKQIVRIDRFFPSSKTCSKCGYIHQSLSLKERSWICPDCGEKLDRDLNAAKNILKEGKKVNKHFDCYLYEMLLSEEYKDISVGTVDNRREGEIRPILIGTTVETFKIHV